MPIYVYNLVGFKLPTRLRLGLSHLNQLKVQSQFPRLFNPLCLCSLEAKSVSHLFLHCHYYLNIF